MRRAAEGRTSVAAAARREAPKRGGYAGMREQQTHSSPTPREARGLAQILIPKTSPYFMLHTSILTMHKLGLLVGIASLLSGCIKDSNPPIPAYIYVESMDFIPRGYALEGSASQRITDVWVSVNGQLIGADNLPALLPVILNDSTEEYDVTVRAGIENEGIANRKFDYPFFTRYTERRRLAPGKVDTIRAFTKYDSTATIRNLEDFEGVGLVFGDDRDGNVNTEIIKTQADVFEGDFSGQLFVDSLNIVCTAATSVFFSNLQPTGSAYSVYLELNYKTELPISVGLIARYSNGTTETIMLGGMNPKDTWNKIYFNLTSTIYTQNAQSYAILFETVNSSQKPNPKVYIDNVKLLHY